jgi:hypothetical protein
MKLDFLQRTALCLAFVISGSTQWLDPVLERDPRPNILVILTDDQDLHLGSMGHMDQLQSQLVQKGTTFTRHYGHVSQWYVVSHHGRYAEQVLIINQLPCSSDLMDRQTRT